jgi:hypothetical protein
MSALGHKRTEPRQFAMSAIIPKTDIACGVMVVCLIGLRDFRQVSFIKIRRGHLD